MKIESRKRISKRQTNHEISIHHDNDHDRFVLCPVRRTNFLEWKNVHSVIDIHYDIFHNEDQQNDI